MYNIFLAKYMCSDTNVKIYNKSTIPKMCMLKCNSQ